MTDHTSNDLICIKCNTEYKVKDNNKDDDCTPEKCSIIEICECCCKHINCQKENLHIISKLENDKDDLIYCYDCCQNKDEKMLNEGWKCDECNDVSSDDDDSTDEYD